MGHRLFAAGAGHRRIARIGVTHHWVVDLAARALAAYRLEAGRWIELGMYGDERDARIEPFDSVALDVAAWWP